VPRVLKFRQPIPLEIKMRSQRRGPRMNSRVPVRVRWLEEQKGAAREENAHTRVVNFYGCLLVSPKPLALEQRLRLTNLATQRTIGAVVVWQGKKQMEGWELGVELVEPEMDFWGVEL
jgi:hypothetical protein